MAKWKDKTRGYGESTIIEGSEIKFGQFRLSVHRHIDHPKDMWLASASYIFNCKELASKDLRQAKVQAKAILQVILQDTVDEIAKPSGI